MSTVKISALIEKATMDGSEEVLINDSGTSKKFSTQRFLDVKSDCETSESNASASAVAAAASAASAASVYDSFDDRYLGVKTSDPTVDNDGDALVQGMLYFDSTNSLMKVYDGSTWITTSSATLATLDVYKFTATSGQTVFTGTDDDANTLAIKPTAEIVTLNGIVLETGTDYSVTATTLTLTSGATTGDEVNVYAFGNFELADHYNKTISDGRFAAIAHNHSGVYEPADATILKDADIGVTVQGYDADTAKTDVAQTFTATQSFGDNVKAQFGASDDLQIYHDGSNSYIDDTLTGNLIIRAHDRIYLKNYATDELHLVAIANDAVNLYYDNSQKLATTSTGIDVTGTVTADGLTLQSSEDIVSWASGNGIVESPNNLYIRSTGAYNLLFQTNGSERMRIDSSGNVGIGTTSPSEKLYVSGNIYATGNVTAYSDERIKKDIKEIPNALDAVDSIRGVSYTRTDTEEDSVGVIAQEVEALFPELITEDNEGMKSVNYNGLIGVLFSAVKELSAKVKELEAK